MIPLDLQKIDFSTPDEVCGMVIGYHQAMFPNDACDYIELHFRDVDNMFAGRYDGFQAMDAPYHDLEHTLQTTLCLAHLLYNRHVADVQPVIDSPGFHKALIGIMFHDIGYLKESDDTEGSGAKYTHIHESRSCRHARAYLAAYGWEEDDIQGVENMISCTGPNSKIDTIPFRSDDEKCLGQAVCTADFIGQMSDPNYVPKLKVLYQEFEENYNFREIPKDQRPFSSYEDLLRKTRGFWEHFVSHKMAVECDGLWDYFKDPVTSNNLYLQAVENNIQTVDHLVAKLN